MVIHAVVSTISRRNPDQSQDSSALMLVGQNRVTMFGKYMLGGGGGGE